MVNQTNLGLSRKSALARFWGEDARASVNAGSVSVHELPFQGVIKLQCRSCSAQFLEAVKAVLGFDLPQQANTRSGESLACLWVAPNEWLVVTPADQDQELAQKLSQHLTNSLPDANVAIIVITDSRVALAITGMAAADLLAKGCSLDLHPTQFKPGQCAVSLLEQVPITLYTEPEMPSYRMLVDRSYAAFVWEWLLHAINEFKYMEIV